MKQKTVGGASLEEAPLQLMSLESPLYSLEKKRTFFTRDLKEERCSAYFVHLFASWCGPCIPELTDFRESKLLDFLEENHVCPLFIAFKDEEKQLISLVERSKLSSFFKENLYMTSGEDFLLSFKTTKIPETFIFDKEGLLQKHYVGAQDWKKELYRRQLLDIIP